MQIGGAKLVDGIDLEVAAGEMVAIVGPNGAGKSTLLRMLSGDLRPTDGAVAAEAARLAQLSAARAGAASRDAVAACQRQLPLHGRGDRADGRRRAQPRRRAAAGRAALHEVGLEHFRDRQLPTLSGGEQQRAHFARVLVQLACGEALHGPGLLLLDEPTSSLDLRHQIDLVETARLRAQRRHRRDRDPARPQSRHALCRPHRAAAPGQTRRRRRPPRNHHGARRSGGFLRSMSRSAIPTTACPICCRRPCGRSAIARLNARRKPLIHRCHISFIKASALRYARSAKLRASFPQLEVQPCACPCSVPSRRSC